MEQYDDLLKRARRARHKRERLEKKIGKPQEKTMDEILGDVCNIAFERPQINKTGKR